jgi:hypothetical protein
MSYRGHLRDRWDGGYRQDHLRHSLGPLHSEAFRGRLDGFAAGVAADARSVFSWSYHHLSPQACRLFRLLSLQPAADITVAASARLLGAPPDETPPPSWIWRSASAMGACPRPGYASFPTKR